jgi:predicted nucleotidyltransferase
MACQNYYVGARNQCSRRTLAFGNRAKGTSRPDSDVDIALALMPAQEDHDRALGDHFALPAVWQRKLETIVGGSVSLTAIVPNTPGDTECEALA